MNDRPAYDFAVRMYETREAFKSIVGAIKGAGDMDKLDSAQLRVVLDAIKGATKHAEDQLDELDCAAWEEANLTPTTDVL